MHECHGCGYLKGDEKCPRCGYAEGATVALPMAHPYSSATKEVHHLPSGAIADETHSGGFYITDVTEMRMSEGVAYLTAEDVRFLAQIVAGRINHTYSEG